MAFITKAILPKNYQLLFTGLIGVTSWTPKSDCAIYERSLIGNNLEHKAGTVSVNRTEGVIGPWMYCIGGHGDKTEIIGAWAGTHALSIPNPGQAPQLVLFTN